MRRTIPEEDSSRQQAAPSKRSSGPVACVAAGCCLRHVACFCQQTIGVVLVLVPACLQEYLCRRCGSTFTSLDAVHLLDPMTGAFRCEECQAELEANIDAAGLGGTSGGAASRQQMQQYAKRMLEKMEVQLRPVLGECVMCSMSMHVKAFACMPAITHGR